MRMPLTVALVAIGVIVVGLLLARNTGETLGARHSTEPTPVVPGGAATGEAGVLPVADIAFLTRAAESSQAQIELAQLAQRTSDDSSVDRLAANIRRDMEQVRTDVEDLADRRDVDFPGDVVGLPGPTETQQAAHDRIAELEGAAFNRAWIEELVAEQRSVVNLFDRGSSSIDADVRALASAALPILKARLTEAEQLQKELPPTPTA